MRAVTVFALLVLAGWATDAAAACPCTGFFTGEARPFIAEGIARDAATERFFVAGVAARRIVAIRNGRARAFAQLPDHYSPLGIAVAGGSLWVTAAVLPQGAGREGPSALIDFDLGGKVKAVFPVTDEGRHVLNDLTFAPDGTVYASDARDGSLYSLAPGAGALTRLGRRGLLKSPQGMAVSADGRSLLVADYALGLVKVDLATAAFAPLQIPAGAKTKGIDGLVRLADGSFLASQNGTKEPHILRLTLSPDWSQLLAQDVIAADDPAVADPSLVLADDSGAYVVGVSQWNSFGATQTPTKSLQPWRIVRLDIHSSTPATAPAVTPFELNLHAAKYDGKEVQVRGWLVSQFENAGLWDSKNAYDAPGHKANYSPACVSYSGLDLGRHFVSRYVVLDGIFWKNTPPAGTVVINNGGCNLSTLAITRVPAGLKP